MENMASIFVVIHLGHQRAALIDYAPGFFQFESLSQIEGFLDRGFQNVEPERFDEISLCARALCGRRIELARLGRDQDRRDMLQRGVSRILFNRSSPVIPSICQSEMTRPNSSCSSF